MLTGRRLFEGETTTDVLAAVIKVDPDLESLPKKTSPQVRRMLRRCLQRDPRKRLYAAADAVLELDDETAATPTGGVARRNLVPWALAAVLTAALAVVLLRPTAAPEEVFRRQFEIQLPDRTTSLASYRPVVSPDGRWLAVTLSDSLGPSRIMVRSLETGAYKSVENSAGSSFPFWSPDSRFLGFFQDARLRKLHLESGTVQTITTAMNSTPRGGTWSSQGKIVFSPGSNDRLMMVDAEGGPVSSVTDLDTTMVDGSHRWPQFLPDGHHFVFTQWSNVPDERAEKGGIFVGSLEGDTPRRILRDVSATVISPTGQLLFHRNGRLMAAPFDIATATVKGEPLLVTEKVSFQTSNGSIGASVSDRGDVFVSTHDPDSRLRLGWLGRDGTQIDSFTEDLPLASSPQLAPDGSHFVAEFLDDVGSVEIWIGDLNRGSIARLSRFESDCWGAVFSPNGREVIYGVQTLTGGILYRHDISGARNAEAIMTIDFMDAFTTAGHWFAPDQVLIERLNPKTKADEIYLLDLQKKEMSPVLSSDFNQATPQISPDGRWLAYLADESGRPEIYVRNWPGLDQKWQVSREGGHHPHWRNDGAELVFSTLGGREIRGVDFEVSGDEPRMSLPHRITSLSPNIRFTAETADHQRYLVGFSTGNPQLPPVQVLVGWGLAAQTTGN